MVLRQGRASLKSKQYARDAAFLLQRISFCANRTGIFYIPDSTLRRAFGLPVDLDRLALASICANRRGMAVEGEGDPELPPPELNTLYRVE